MPHSPAASSSAAEGHLHVFTSSSGVNALISLIGELDLATAPALGEAVHGLIATGVRRLTFDVGELTFVDPYGLRPILQARHDLLLAGQPPEPVVLRSPTARFLALLDATRLVEAFPVELAA